MTSGAALRKVVEDLPGYVPGRRPAPGQVFARLASNETPYPPLPSVVDAIAAAAAEANRYPDPAAEQLVAALAARLGVPQERVAPGGGSVALLQQLLAVAADPGDEVVFAWRSFEAYPVLTRLAGAAAVAVPLRGQELDLGAMAGAVTSRTRLVFLCSPNNPTGPALDAADVTRFLDTVPDRVLVVLDEAYAEFVTRSGAVDGLRLLDRPNLVVLRTFSKAYGLAGLRVGYAVAQPDVVAALRKVALPFSVSSLGQAAALASLAAEDELAVRVKAVAAERDRLRSGLLDLGFEVPDTQGNFVWLPLGDATTAAAGVFEQGGVLVRPFAGDGLRITVGEAADQELVLAAAAQVAAAR